jgi:16S rRNA A1518/A1519 N6-dimethyltransferase RsmA/KsgA/DIM1 with predicted DNA glycosylase/AP lyase activity
MIIQKDFTDKNSNHDLLEKHVSGRKLRKIIDIGAWWGPWTLHWQSRADSVEIFEPNKKILPMLEHNISNIDRKSVV